MFQQKESLKVLRVTDIIQNDEKYSSQGKLGWEKGSKRDPTRQNKRGKTLFELHILG